MKKRTTLLITSLVVAFSLLAVTVYANVNSYEGYEAFKELMQSSHEGDSFEEIHSGAMSGSLSLVQDGQKVLTLSGTFQGDALSKMASGNLILEQNGLLRNLDLYAQDKTFYIFDEENQEYYQMNHNEKMDADWEYDEDQDDRFENRSEKMTAAQEELMDFLAGDLKDDFEVSYEANGNQTIQFELTEEEMPMLLNLMISAGNSMKDFREDDRDAEREAEKALLEEQLSIYPLFAQLSSLDDSIASIEDEFALNLVRMSITVDENKEPISMNFALNISGKDQEGVFHTQEIQAEFAVDQESEVVVASPVLDGKNMILIDEEVFEGFGCADGHEYGASHGRGRR